MRGASPLVGDCSVGEGGVWVQLRPVQLDLSDGEGERVDASGVGGGRMADFPEGFGYDDGGYNPAV